VNVPHELKPYFETAYICGFPLCDYCGAEPPFTSAAEKHSDQWYLDAAAAMKEAQWVIPEVQMAACASCAKQRRLGHNAQAFSPDAPND